MDPICAELGVIDAKLSQNGLQPSSGQVPDATERVLLLWRLYLATEERVITSYEEMMTLQEKYDKNVDELHTNSLEADNKLVAIQRELDALRQEQENTLAEMEKEQSTLNGRFLDELKDKDLEVCKLRDCVSQLQQENSEAKMLLDEQEKKHKTTVDAVKQELHTNSLDAVNQLVSIQREVEALKNELENNVAEMEKKQRCLDELKDKDIEVCKLQDCVNQLQQENSEAKMLLNEQEKKHKVTVDAFKQELHLTNLKTNNKLVATQSQVEALKQELENTVTEMDKKQRCLDELKDKDLEVCELQDCVNQLKKKNSLAQELLDDQKRYHKISMDAIKEEVELLTKKSEKHKADKNQDGLQDYKYIAELHTNNLEADNKLVAIQRELDALRQEQENTLAEMEKEQSTLNDRFLGELKDKDLEVCKLQDCVNQLQQENSEAKMLLDEQEKKHKITVDAFKQELHTNSLDAVNQLVAIQREVEALKNELENNVAEMEKKQRCLDELKDKDLEVCKLQDCVNQLQQEYSEAKMLLDEQEKKHKITVDAIEQETNNTLVATQSQVEALKQELENTVTEMDKKQRCLDELKDKDLEVCELQDCVNQLKKKNNLAQELLDDQKRNHKISMDAIKEEVELLTKKADKKQDGLQDYKDIAEAQEKLLQNRDEELSEMHKLVKHFTAQLKLSDEKLVLAQERDLEMENLKDELEKLKGELNLKNQQLHANSLEAENKLVATQSQVDAFKNDLKNTVTEMAKKMKDKDLEVCKLQDCVTQLQQENSEAKMLLEEQEKKHKITVDAFKQELQCNSLEDDNKLVATQRQIEALKKDLENTVIEMDKKQRCLDELKDKDLEVCDLQDYVKQLEQKNNLAQELLDDQKRNHKISMDAIKEKVELLTKNAEKHKADKKQQPNQDGLQDYRDYSLEDDNKLVATQRQIEALKKELENTVIEMDKKQRCLDELKDKDLEVCKLQDCVNQLQQENSEAKMLLNEQEKKHKVTVDAFKQEMDFLKKEVAFAEESNVDLEKLNVEIEKLKSELKLKNQQLHANSLEADNRLVATQSQVEALKKQVENTVAEMDEKQRCLDELKDKDLEVCDLQDYVKQLEQKNNLAQELLDDQKRNHKISMDAIKEKVELLTKNVEKNKADKKQQPNQDGLQDYKDYGLEDDNKLVATQRQIEALKRELENTVIEMDKKQRCLDELKDKDLEVCDLQDYVKRLEQKNNLAQELLDDQKRNHKISMAAIKETVELLTKNAEEHKADKKQQPNQDGLHDYKNIAENQQRLLQERAEELSESRELMNQYVALLQSTEEKLVLSDKNLVAALSKAEAQEKELIQTRKEASQLRRCLDELKDKDLQVCKLQDCVNQLQQESSKAKMLLNEQEKKHKVTVDAFKQEMDFLKKEVAVAEESNVDLEKLNVEIEKLKSELKLKNQQLHANSLEADNRLVATQSQVEALKKQVENTVTEMDKKQRCIDELKDKDLEVCDLQDYVKQLEQKNNLAQELLDDQKRNHKISMDAIKEKVELLKQSTEEKLVLADKNLVAALSKAEAQEKELIQTRKEASQLRRCLNELKDKDLEVCELQDCVKQLKQKNNLAQELLDDQKRNHKISMDAIKEKVELLNKKSEEHKADKKQLANQHCKDIAETKQRLTQERAEELSAIRELMNHYVARLHSTEEKLVLADKKTVAAESKAEAKEKELIQTLREASQQRSKYHDQIYKLRDRHSDTKDQQKREIEMRDDRIKELERQTSFLTRKLEKLTETTEMMDKVNTELLREKRQFYRDLNGDFLV